ncbi:MAG: hypothetical protein GY696_01455 [Gammaproteobacteria bacterium]|nr:hypothetical protein [Gammaproteobacteria bacterium]
MATACCLMDSESQDGEHLQVTETTETRMTDHSKMSRAQHLSLSVSVLGPISALRMVAVRVDNGATRFSTSAILDVSLGS